MQSLIDGVRSGAPRAVRETKALLKRVPTLDRDVAFDEMGRLSDELFASPEAQIGMQAFKEKQLPNWSDEGV